ncbi:MAG: sugar phosphate nucleotidyltransferase [Bacteroidota bacterium]|nr:sugar phosphate nucleotidyltransferase [Bacteroidota bacterium]
MNIIIPMAGMGKRLRPHTLTTPKPLVKVCNREIVKILCQDIVKTCGGKVDSIGFVVGHFGEKVERGLMEVAESLGAKGKIFYQEKPLGTADAVWSARELLEGNTVVAFADTLFNADFTMDLSKDGIIWTSIVENPSAYGVVKKDELSGEILQFVEKPQEFVSNEAIIGIYYFKSGERLYEEIKRLRDNNIMRSGEYQLTDCLENMLQTGYSFTTEIVSSWMDCGNKNAVVNTNKQLLEMREDMRGMQTSVRGNNTCVIPPYCIGQNVQLENCIIGPYVTIEDRAEIKNSVIKNSIIGMEAKINNVLLENSLVGNNVVYQGKTQNVSIGDYSNIEE